MRAQHLYAALQDTAWDRVPARLTRARPERGAGQLARADRTLAALREILAAPPTGYAARRVEDLRDLG
ncbi:hypothetical protein OG407_38645 [Streptomyces sp. NBC_01515]|uniref:hypothetical protein n=1 Tax=Streptomyces sp. NBC_01515 TaxID=2903890 RepID=UPI00386E0D6B